MLSIALIVVVFFINILFLKNISLTNYYLVLFYFAQQRSVAAETTATFENTMEDQLQMKEMQSAARELNDAFSFRRSINYDLKEEADILKEVTGDEANVVAAATAVASEEAVSTIKNRKKRRKKKKATPPPVEEIPQELEMPTGDDWFNPESVMTADSLENDDVSRKSRMSRLQQSASNANIDGGSESQNEEFVLPEFSETSEKAATDAAVAKFNSQRDQLENIDPQSMTENGFDTAKYDAVEEANAQARFAAQLSQDWNNSILDNSETLEPLGKIMERLAILEEERAATEKRLEEEFRLRTDLEERFYKEKRQILEEGAAEIQAEAYENVNNKLTNSSSAQNKNLY